ncbi:uncharacterized protein LOC120260176 [Dioscorea cayenensis subsp. rotundata]|uniref:Uncharacterized protein LOC120260176 n=1 Tax=Dioscorea cayennensis subsp. rotundata TaxID=55577 RepID=A0AB40B9A0_DIOCR|nr:uncharacterized protein LOC120260176 [Dioscorea cayenensis subsp. rotundata]
MASSSALSLTTPVSTHSLKQSSFLPFSSISINNPNKPLKNKNTITITITISISISISSSVKIVRFPSLDRHASRYNRLRFVRKLQTLLLSKPRHFLPLRVLSRCRSYLSPPPARSLLSMILRYPSIFRLFYSLLLHLPLSLPPLRHPHPCRCLPRRPRIPPPLLHLLLSRL